MANAHSDERRRAQRCSWTLAHGQAHHTVHQLTGEPNAFVVWSRLGHAERVTATGELAGCQAAVVVVHAAVDEQPAAGHFS